jgi:hypothetical protein
MSAYTASYQIRYSIPSLQQQTEVAVITAASNIKNEAESVPGHADRLRWAIWANENSSVAFEPFRWPVAMNPSIATAIQADPDGSTVPDGDVQFVVNSNVDAVIADWVAKNPALKEFVGGE